MSSYTELARAQREPQAIRDHSARWEKLLPLADLNGDLRKRVELFAAEKRVSVAALEQLGTRVRVRRSGGVELAWAGRNGASAVTAIKYRPIPGASRDCVAEEPSVWLRPIVAGNRDARDWFVAEGETDAARLYDLIGDAAAILCLPAGAKAFKREWADVIPRGATVHLCHDADADGDEGADKAARILGGKTVRVRPTWGAKDWCEWEGDRQAFVELVAAARAQPAYTFLSADDFLALSFPDPQPLLGDRQNRYLAAGCFLLVFGEEGSAKSTWTVDGIAHLAAGCDWLGLAVPRPLRFCVVENEGSAALFRDKLEDKAMTWGGPDWTENVHVYAEPWGQFSFADAGAREQLRDYSAEHRIDVVVCNPLLGIGASGSGKPDETAAFVEQLKSCGLWRDIAVWAVHHENKAGQISGDWGRHPDTVVLLERDGKRPRTKLTWRKTRWASVGVEDAPRTLLLEWELETKGYRVIEADVAGVADAELRARLDEYLAANPRSATKTIKTDVDGNNERLRRLLDEGLEEGHYDSEPGSRGAILWSLRDEEALSYLPGTRDTSDT